MHTSGRKNPEILELLCWCLVFGNSLTKEIRKWNVHSEKDMDILEDGFCEVQQNCSNRSASDNRGRVVFGTLTCSPILNCLATAPKWLLLHPLGFVATARVS